MDFECFARKIGFSSAFSDSLTPYREKLLAHSSEEVPDFMNEDFYTRYYPLCQGSVPAEELYPKMAEVCRIVRKEPAAARYASMLHYAFYQANPVLDVPWPSPEGLFGPNAGIFNLMVALSAFPLIQRNCRTPTWPPCREMSI